MDTNDTMDTKNVISLDEAKKKKKAREDKFKEIMDLVTSKPEPKRQRKHDILDSQAFPGFDILNEYEARAISDLMAIIRESEKVSKKREAQRRDPWEAFAANLTKPTRVSVKARKQKAWETYRELAFTLRKKLMSD